MRINSKGNFVYIQYGSKGSYFCEQCKQVLNKPHPRGHIFDSYYLVIMVAGKPKCNVCNNVAVRT